ncbi:MAG: hypothetical protein COB50_05385 [Thiotrichales bacterium]|nr:MAG: hypothetical protein COB50_05385 [Thiotrichales bacterium]
MRNLPNFRKLLHLVSDYDNRIVEGTISEGEITKFRNIITPFNEALCISAKYETNMLFKNNIGDGPSNIEDISSI